MVLSMERWSGKVAIVTGASAGIGAAIAKQLVENGLIVIGAARRANLVDEIAKTLEGKNGKLHSYKLDLSNEQEIKDLFKWTTENFGPVHILINNAGIHVRNDFIDEDIPAWRKTLEVNVLGLSIATTLAIKIMKENGINGHIININSITGHSVPQIPFHNMYPASKHAVTALTETFRQDINKLNLKIKITSISPGAVDTPIFDENIRGTPGFKKLIGDKLLKPEDIADGVVYALSTPLHVQVHELTIKPINEKL
ncbi:unnamed protein product [Phyllotreta striolata]|uniref:Farnesol dehydrogenase-like n=1 Tax=Phyllotreta striolata TaxID=444603 RepID=A0A9N9TMI5_PHYSR|nr:unnamed protein product [Phyllotreta striolata]